jgi:aspartate racemase
MKPQVQSRLTRGEKPMRAMIIALLATILSAQSAPGNKPAQLPLASDMKTLGLVGGTSWYSTVDYYRYINKAVNDAYGDNTNPPLIIFNLNQQKIHELQAQNQWNQIAAILIDAVNRLHAGGAQAVLFCANTPYKVYVQVAQNSKIPILHIADATGNAIQKSGLKKIGLIGTKYTMEDGFMADRLKEKYGVETLVPNSAPARKELHRIIQKELGMGIFKPESKKFVLDQIEELKRRGAQGIILGCTEFPLIIKQSDVTVPVFDTTHLHSQMAVDFILGKPGLAHVQETQ